MKSAMKSILAALVLIVGCSAFAESSNDELILRNDVIKATQALVKQYYPTAPIRYHRGIEHSLDVGLDKKTLVDTVNFYALDQKNETGCSIKIYFSQRYFVLHCDNTDRSRLMTIKGIMKPDLSSFDIFGDNIRFEINLRTPQQAVRKGVVRLTRFTAIKSPNGAIQSYRIQKAR